MLHPASMLRIEQLTYRIGGRILFDQASATIAPGHRIGLVGRNGSGKTTLIRLISGELQPDGGRIKFLSAGASASAARRRRPVRKA